MCILPVDPLVQCAFTRSGKIKPLLKSESVNKQRTKNYFNVIPASHISHDKLCDTILCLNANFVKACSTNNHSNNVILIQAPMLLYNTCNYLVHSLNENCTLLNFLTSFKTTRYHRCNSAIRYVLCV